MIYEKKLYYAYHLSLIIVAILAVFGYVFFYGRPIFINADQQLTYHLYYEEWLRLIRLFLRSGDLPFYSWYKFLGSDFYSSASIYVTSDLFLPLLLLFKSIDQALFVESMLLILISSLTFAYYLKCFGIKKDQLKLLFGIVYAFSGLAVLFYGNYMFLRFYAFLPLLFAGTEQYLKNGRYRLFIISVFILSFSSIYFMFPTSLFLIFYFIFSYGLNQNKMKFSLFFKKSGILVIYFSIGFSLSLVLNLPAILYILESSRIGLTESTGMFWDLRALIGFVANHGTAPFALFTDIPYLFYSGFNGHGSWYSIYITGFIISIVLSYIFKIDDKNKRSFIGIVLVSLAIILIKPINSLFHGFSEPTFRFAFLNIFIYLMIAAYSLDNFEQKYIIMGYAIYTVLLYFSLITGFVFGLFDLSTYQYHLLMIVLSNLSGWIIVFAYYRSKTFWMALILIEMFISASIVTWTLNKDYYHYEPSLTKEYVDYYQSIDDSRMYRIYIDPRHLLPTSDMNLNQSLHYQFMSTSSYDSAYEPSLQRFLKLNQIDWHLIHINNPEVLRMLGVKYFVVYDESELPIGYEFEYVYNLDFLKVYKLMNYRSIGYTYSDFKTIDEIDHTQISWNETAYLNLEDMTKVQSILPSISTDLEILSFSSNHFSGQIELDQTSFLFLSIPNNPGWKILDNGIQQDVIDVNGGFIGLVLNQGYHYIEMYYVPRGLKLGMLGTVISGLAWMLIELLNYYRNMKFKTKNSN